MDMSKILSGRQIQPGTEKFGKPAHDQFLDVLRNHYPSASVVSEPRILKNLGLWAAIPDFAVTVNGRTALFEIKRQGPRGNAHERLYKFFTPKMIEEVKSLLGAAHYPVYAILCDELSVNPRYVREFSQQLERHEYLLWESYSPTMMVSFLDNIFNGSGTFDLSLLPFPPK